MEYDLMDTHCADDRELFTAPESLPSEQSTPDSLLSSPMYSEMSVSMLAAQCLRELSNYRQGEPYSKTYAVELFRRATVQGNQEARVWIHYCFGEVVRGWLHRHPNREAAARLESEEYYVAQAFERFWQATASPQRLEFSQLSAALQYLRVCLNGAILDMLRASARSREVSLPEPVESGESQAEDSPDSSGAWEVLKTIIPNVHQRRLAYLLFPCGLKPREITRCCPQEWSDVQEISRLRRDIMERLLCNADLLRWPLNEKGSARAGKTRMKLKSQV